MSKAKQNKSKAGDRSFRQSPLKNTLFDPRVAYGMSSLVLVFLVYFFAVRVIDTASMWTAALLFIAVYFLANDSYKFVKAVKNQGHKIRPSGKRKKA